MLRNAKNGTVVVDGAEMSYVSFGFGEKVLILLPGLSDGLATVKGKALLLAGYYRIFAKKYRVYAFSRKDCLPEGYSIRDMSDDQAKAMRQLGIEKASVIGESQGGMIAQYLAIDHPELIEKLIIAVSAPRINELTAACVNRWICFAKQGDHRKLMIDVAENTYSSKSLWKYRIIYPIIGFIGKPSDYGRFLINAEAILRFSAIDDLKNISCPALIIGGEEDKIVGIQASYEMHKNIANSDLIVYPGLGHGAFEEAKDFNRRVLDFLET